MLARRLHFIKGTAVRVKNLGERFPIDRVMTSGSGLDPDLTPDNTF
jgi:K+-transporting ATPase c subunit